MRSVLVLTLNELLLADQRLHLIALRSDCQLFILNAGVISSSDGGPWLTLS